MNVVEGSRRVAEYGAPMADSLVLLTGATGYIGGRLLARLEERGVPVRCLSRRPDVLAGRVGPRTEIVSADVEDASATARALEGVDTAYYLIHSMGSARPFAKADREMAESFGRTAREQGVRRIVYLGGLGSGATSDHLTSRQEVGRILRASGVPTVEFRASIVIGSGSTSFDMLRALVDRLPVMVTPRWVTSECQPIAVEDVLDYLMAALDYEADGGEVFEIGGSDVVSYRELMAEYARQRGLRRAMIPVPVLTPGLSSHWLGLVAPVHARVGRRLIESLRSDTVVRDPRALDVFPVRPRSCAEAIARALRNEDRAFAETRWSDEADYDRASFGGLHLGSRLIDSRSLHVDAAPAAAFAPIVRIGGRTGWYSARWLWTLRGMLDRVAGGPGLRRGRRDPTSLRVGDTLDFWRVEQYEPDRLLRLRAEMRVPGRAWLQFEVEPDATGSTITQTALFDPAGIAGLGYWYAVWPFHHRVFDGMLHGIARAAAPVSPGR
jgi:uncharacterized protein YbjT (DUF2867 family)